MSILAELSGRSLPAVDERRVQDEDRTRWRQLSLRNPQRRKNVNGAPDLIRGLFCVGAKNSQEWKPVAVAGKQEVARETGKISVRILRGADGTRPHRTNR